MKTYWAALLSVGLFTLVSKAEAQALFGSTSAGGPGELWQLSPTDGSAVHDVGALNDSLGNNYAVTGLAFDPLNGTLYGSTGNTSGQKLLTINPATALVTVVGNFGVGTGNTMTDLAFDSSGHLFGISSSGGANLYSIDLGTGQGTQIGSSGVSFTAGGGLAISPGGLFYGTPTHPQFGTYDPTTGTFTLIANPTKPGGVNTALASLAFDGNTLYAMNLSSPTHLVTIDTTTGAVTDLGTSVALIDGIAFQPIPEPATISMFAVGGVITLLAGLRKKNKAADRL